jgi:protein-disulfide isomerase-like protein with CxxC motif
MEQLSMDIELKEKASHLFKKYNASSNAEIINKLLQELQTMGFAECISEQDETYKVISAFHYAEDLVDMIQIANEDEIPE